MNATTWKGFNEHVARALAESGHMNVDPSWMEDVPDHPVTVGGFGTVKVARLFGQIVAVKDLRITGAPADRARFSIRFARELKVWAPLNHPNLLKLYGFYINPSITVAQFICPFYPHGHIRNYIENFDPDESTRLNLAKDTALGLQHLHELHVVHGDLKELNVLVDAEPRALLCDYGLAKIVDPEGTGSGLTTTGTPISIRFASPELLQNSRPSMTSDIWAWGCLFLNMLTDIGPYDGTTEIACVLKIAQRTPPADLSAMTLSANLRDMLERCWNQDPLVRPTITQCADIIDSEQHSHHLVPVWNASSWISFQILEVPGGAWAASVAFSPDGFLVAITTRDGKLHMWDVGSGRHLTNLLGHLAWGIFHAITFSPDGGHLVCSTGQARFYTLNAVHMNPESGPGSYPSWELNENMTVSTTGDVQSIAFSPDGSLLAVGRENGGGVYHVRDGRSWELLFNVDEDKEDILSVAFSPTGKWLASGDKKGVVRVWDIVTLVVQGMFSKGSMVAKLERHTHWVRSVAFSPDGRWLATGSEDKSVIIWNVSSWESVEVLPSEGWVASVAVSPDSTRLASASVDGNIQLWDTASWASVMILEGHDPYNSIHVAFSPDGSRLASASTDGTVRIWHAKPALIPTQRP